MKRMLIPLLLPAAIAAGLLPASAAGLHLGWCKGVGNPHHNAGCPGTTTGTSNPGLTTAPQTQTGTGGTGPQLVNPGNTLPPTTGGGGTQPPAGGTQPPQNIIVVVPNPPTVFGGFSPGQPIIGQSGSFTGGRAPLPQAVPQAVPQRVPTPAPYPVPTPQPYLVPQPQTIIVVPRPPTTVTGYGRPPQIIGQYGSFTGGRGAVPTPTPYRVPYPRPTPVPTASPNRIPQLIPTPLPKPPGGQVPGTGNVTVVHNKIPGKVPGAHKHVTPQVGRQKAHAIPRFTDPERGGTVDCVASGFHRRYHTGPDGRRVASGVLTHVELPDAVARDVPAEKPLHAGCMVKIKRRISR